MANIFDILDTLFSLSRPFRRGVPRERPVDPSELRVRSQMAQDAESSLAEAARMLAYEKQDKKCARCGTAIQEDTASLRLVTAELGLRPDNAILVCGPCDKAMQSS